jgi:glutaredoxin 3
MKYLLSAVLFFLTIHINAQKEFRQIKESKKEKIIVYGSDSCHSCLDTKDFLTKRNIKFIYYDIDLNTKKEQEMLEKLQNTNIPINTLNLPVIDNKGAIYLNNGNLNEFLKFLDKNIKKDEN